MSLAVAGFVGMGEGGEEGFRFLVYITKIEVTSKDCTFFL